MLASTGWGRAWHLLTLASGMNAFHPNVSGNSVRIQHLYLPWLKYRPGPPWHNNQTCALHSVVADESHLCQPSTSSHVWRSEEKEIEERKTKQAASWQTHGQIASWLTSNPDYAINLLAFKP